MRGCRNRPWRGGLRGTTLVGALVFTTSASWSLLWRCRGLTGAPLAFNVWSGAAERLAGALPLSSGRPLPLRGCVALHADAQPSAAAPARTWQEALVAAQALELRLQNLTKVVEDKATYLDLLFTGKDVTFVPKIPPVQMKAPRESTNVKLPQRDPNADETADMFKWMEPAESSSRRLVDKNPPILAFNQGIRGQLVGIYSGMPDLALPERVYAAQHVAGVGDDATASAAENEKHRASLEALVERLEDLWLQAEAAAEELSRAEVRAEARRPAQIEEWRQRVLGAIVFAYEKEDEAPSLNEIEGYLDILQLEERLLQNLANLEDTTLELEGCRNEYIFREQEAEKMVQGSSEFQRKTRSMDSLEERMMYAKVDVRTIMETARDLRETEAALKSIGEAFGALNPFR